MPEIVAGARDQVTVGRVAGALAGAVVFLGACRFDSGGIVFSNDAAVADADIGGPDGLVDLSDAEVCCDAADPADAPPPADAEWPTDIVEDIVHVPEAAEFGGTADLGLWGNTTIDTDSLLIGGAMPPVGVIFDGASQESDPPGPALAILHVRALTVEAGAVVRVTGARPLVIVATGPVAVLGLVDAAARRDQPGAGGAGPGGGAGVGGNGDHRGTYRDSGGGGAGYGTGGARGGNAECSGVCLDGQADGGDGGGSYGTADLAVLAGGSGGGNSTSECWADPAGAGGGAVQIYSAVSIRIGFDGGIHVGGGGGGGGRACSDNLGAAAGGGSGGAVFLQSPSVVHEGVLAGNGGGGGGSAGSTGDVRTDGDDGWDAQFGVALAEGGGDGGTYGAPGGAGGTRDAAPVHGGDEGSGDGNGGGGGGAVGRIVVLVHSDGDYDPTGSSSSPEVVVGTY